MPNDTVYLFIQVVVNTKHRNIHDAIRELQENTRVRVSSTANVHVQQIKIIDLYTKN